MCGHLNRFSLIAEEVCPLSCLESLIESWMLFQKCPFFDDKRLKPFFICYKTEKKECVKRHPLVTERSRARIPFKPELFFFSDFLFATAMVSQLTSLSPTVNTNFISLYHYIASSTHSIPKAKKTYKHPAFP